MTDQKFPTLTLVGLPIGNVEDISVRVLRNLFTADIILAEDTREIIRFKQILKERFASILNNLDIVKQNDQKVYSYRDQNHDRALNGILQQLQESKHVVLVSDSGMPGISDPGWKLIDEILKQGFEIDVIPGPTAVVTALVHSGLPTDRFGFIGFLPRKTSKIVKLMKEYLALDQTVIVYESPFRVLGTLQTIKENLSEIIGEGELKVSASTELTKLHQNTIRGNVDEVISELGKEKLKGEWVMCFRKV